MAKPWLIPDIFINGLPEFNRSSASDARPTGPGWIVPVPTNPAEIKPHLLISITNRTEGLPLAEVALYGNVEDFSVEIWDRETSTFKKRADKISGAYVSKDFENVEVIKITLESVKPMNEMYHVWVTVKACFEISGNFLKYLILDK